MIDIGINLANESFHKDREQVITDAQEANVRFIMITGSCPASNHKALQLAEEYPNYARATAGIHPHHADQVNAETLKDVASCLSHRMVHAVGETGLDFFRDISDRKKQQQVFEAHLELAIQHQLPLFLHQRDAHSAFLPIIKAYRDQIPNAVVHCFTDEKKALFDYLDLDLHIGITGWVADERRGTHLLPLLGSIPTNRLMIETDGPYLLPRNIKPKPKSRRNEPKYLKFVAEKIAQTLGVDTGTVIRNTSATSVAFFNLPVVLEASHGN